MLHHGFFCTFVIHKISIIKVHKVHLIEIAYCHICGGL